MLNSRVHQNAVQWAERLKTRGSFQLSSLCVSYSSLSTLISFAVVRSYLVSSSLSSLSESLSCWVAAKTKRSPASPLFPTPTKPSWQTDPAVRLRGVALPAPPGEPFHAPFLKQMGTHPGLLCPWGWPLSPGGLFSEPDIHMSQPRPQVQLRHLCHHSVGAFPSDSCVSALWWQHLRASSARGQHLPGCCKQALQSRAQSLLLLLCCRSRTSGTSSA